MDAATDATLSDREVLNSPFPTKQKDEWLADILFQPRQLEMAVLNLDEAQLEHTIPGRWLDHKTGNSSCCRQPYECVYPIQTGPY